MLPATRYESDATLRSVLRERRLSTLLTTLVDRRQEAADLALQRGEMEQAASLEEEVALATHRLGLFEDAMLGILRGRRDRPSPGEGRDTSL